MNTGVITRLKSLVFVLMLPVYAVAQDEPLSELHSLPSILNNQEMRIIEVSYEPGQVSQPHRHNAHVFVYVLEGEIEMQVRGGPIVHLKAGDTFYESPSDIHQLGRNASATQPAKFLVHMLKVAGAPATVPVD